jgi:hypothetical protein
VLGRPAPPVVAQYGQLSDVLQLQIAKGHHQPGPGWTSGPTHPSASPVTAARRQPKQTREELKALLLATGMDILCEQGLGTGAEALTFKRVFDRIEQQTGTRLTNASIIRRVWENQADYQADVLAAVAADNADFEWERTFAAVAEVLEAADLSSPDSRWRGVVELCRVGGAANVAALRESPIWPTWIGVWALTASGEPHQYRQRIESALGQAYSAHALRFEEAYAGLAATFGLKLREPLTVRQFAIASESLAEGSALRHHVSAPDMDGILRPTGPGGELQSWTLFGVGLESLLQQFFVLDPDFVPPGDQP